MPEKVALIGSGNWGSAIAKIVGRNVLDRELFDDEVTMWVYQEQVDGKNLTDIINTEHENVKYLPVRASAARPTQPVLVLSVLSPSWVPSALAGCQVH